MELKEETEYGVSRRKSTTDNKFWIKEERSAAYKRVTSILMKPEGERSEEDKHFLYECSEVVQDVRKRMQSRQRVKERLKEFEDPPGELAEKCAALASAIRLARHLVVYTGAGISTAACIPDYRGANGIWTLLQQGKDIGLHDLSRAEPTLTHMALSQLQRGGLVKHVVSQNCDGLHLRAALPRQSLSELHGNMYIEVCKSCSPPKEYWRLFDVTEHTGRFAHHTRRRCYTCESPLVDTIVHFGERGTLAWPLNWKGACDAADAADTILCIGSSLRVLKKYPWLWCMDKPVKKRPNLYIVNLQWTPKDEQATLKINGRCDEIMRQVMAHLQIPIPRYDRSRDPIFAHATLLHPLEMHTTSRPVLDPSLGEDKSDVDIDRKPIIKAEISSSHESEVSSSQKTEVSTPPKPEITVPCKNLVTSCETECSALPSTEDSALPKNENSDSHENEKLSSSKGNNNESTNMNEDKKLFMSDQNRETLSSEKELGSGDDMDIALNTKPCNSSVLDSEISGKLLKVGADEELACSISQADTTVTCDQLDSVNKLIDTSLRKVEAIKKELDLTNPVAGNGSKEQILRSRSISPEMKLVAVVSKDYATKKKVQSEVVDSVVKFESSRVSGSLEGRVGASKSKEKGPTNARKDTKKKFNTSDSDKAHLADSKLNHGTVGKALQNGSIPANSDPSNSFGAGLCQYCRAQRGSYRCLYYVRHVPVFFNRAGDIDRSPVCECCERLGVVGSTIKRRNSTSKDKSPCMENDNGESCELQDKMELEQSLEDGCPIENSPSPTVLTNPGWFGKGYRKRIKKKR